MVRVGVLILYVCFAFHIPYVQVGTTYNTA